MDGLDRLYYRLVHNLRSQHRNGTDGTMTVADLYQNLVPFRAVRHELGFGELAEYERALLRLLAGERKYATVEPPEARAELRQELAAPHPILGVYRDYANAELRLNPDLLPAAPPIDSPEEQEPEPLPLLTDSEEVEVLPWLSQPNEVAEPRCWSCQADLPSDVEVRFCPFCGTGQQSIPCAGCDTMREPSWSFCVRCGLARESPTA